MLTFLHGGPLPGAEGSLSRWRSGPVRYLITGPEDREFKALTSDEERQAFIDRFWKRRDPTPGSPENELRDLFLRRVEEANRLFVDATREGWGTDRGRIYIQLGPPDEIERDPMQSGERGQIRWIYRSAPTASSGPNRVLVFDEDVSGEYRLSLDPEDYTVEIPFVTRMALGLPPTLVLESPGPSPDEQRMDLARMLLPPGEDELIREVVNVETYLGSLPFVPRFDFYRSTGGLTFVAINIGVEPWILPADSDPSSLLPVARLQSVDDPSRTHDFVYANPFVPAPDNEQSSGYLVFQAGQGVQPGRYRSYLGIFDRARNEAVSRHQDVTVPAFPEDGLALSSLTLARHAEPIAGPGSRGPYKRPFVLAGRRVVPRMAPSFRNGETFSIYFQVYGAADAPLEVEYRFSVRDGDTFRPLGEPIRTGPLDERAVGWQFPMVGWPVAEFRLRVTVRDPRSGEAAARTVDFRVDG